MEEAVIRHEPLFDRSQFHPRTITVFGLGAGGSHTCFELGKLGIETVTGCDFDIVERANVGSSMYGPQHVGRSKADACADIVETFTIGRFFARSCRAKEIEEVGDIVFICVDSMNERKRILYEQCVTNAKVARVIEGRMSAETIRIHSIDPHNEMHLREWDRYWFPDDEALPAHMACGARPVSVGYGAGIAGRVAVALFTQWFASLSDPRVTLVNQVRLDFTTFEGTGIRW